MDDQLFVVNLICHPAGKTPSRIEIESQGIAMNDGTLALKYSLKGDFSRLQIPELRRPRRGGRLWEHTCFEAFLGIAGNPDYYEFNFSPAREWAAHSFHAYRDGGPIENDDLDPKIAVVQEAEKLELSTVIRLDRLWSKPSGASLRLGLAAVIEVSGGRLTYWALKHPPGKPDFHHPDSFVLEVRSPVAGAGAIAYTAKP